MYVILFIQIKLVWNGRASACCRPQGKLLCCYPPTHLCLIPKAIEAWEDGITSDQVKSRPWDPLRWGQPMNASLGRWARRRKIPKAFLVAFRLSSQDDKMVAHRAPPRADHSRPSYGPMSDSTQGTQNCFGPHGGSGLDEVDQDPRILAGGRRRNLPLSEPQATCSHH